MLRPGEEENKLAMRSAFSMSVYVKDTAQINKTIKRMLCLPIRGQTKTLRAFWRILSEISVGFI